jgi:Uma2 family endonuclease
MRLDVEPPFVLVKPLDDERAYYDGLDEDSSWELLGGRLVASPASERHEDLFCFLLTLLRAYLDERGAPSCAGRGTRCGWIPSGRPNRSFWWSPTPTVTA